MLFPLGVWAGTAVSGDIASDLIEHLGVDPAVADDIAATVAQTKTEGEVLREAAKVEVQALQAAIKVGDEVAMEDAMAELGRIQDEAHVLKQSVQRAVGDRLTTEQRAKLALHRIHKRHRAERLMQAFEDRR